MFVSTIQFFFPDIKKEEVTKFSLFALALFFILGAYWPLRLLKDMFFYMKLGFPTALGWDADYGRSLVPVMKMISPFVIAGMVIVYTRLLDLFEKHKLFYIFCSFYSIIFGLTACAVFVSQNFGPEYIGKYPLAILGVLVYLVTESLGSLVVALFWSFAASCNKADEAQRSFPFIIAAAQIGTIGGTSMLIAAYPLWFYYMLCTLSLMMVMVVIHKIVTMIPADQLVSDKVEKKRQPDMFAGIRLLVTQPYLLGVFIASTFYEIIKTFIDFQMKSQAAVFMSESAYIAFSGWFGFWTCFIAFLMSLLGTSYIMKKYGLRFCILLSPITYGAALTSLYLYYCTNPSPENLFWATFITMIIVTAISYAVNNPAKEMMYIPTSNDAKFKVKGITDTVGSRGAKAIGSSINNSLNVGATTAAKVANLVAFGTLFGLGFIVIWAIAALYVGNKNAQLIRDKQIIE
jgi:ATP:ADP antiporter, AAA family